MINAWLAQAAHGASVTRVSVGACIVWQLPTVTHTPPTHRGLKQQGATR